MVLDPSSDSCYFCEKRFSNTKTCDVPYKQETNLIPRKRRSVIVNSIIDLLYFYVEETPVLNAIYTILLCLKNTHSNDLIQLNSNFLDIEILSTGNEPTAWIRKKGKKLKCCFEMEQNCKYTLNVTSPNKLKYTKIITTSNLKWPTTVSWTDVQLTETDCFLLRGNVLKIDDTTKNIVVVEKVDSREEHKQLIEYDEDLVVVKRGPEGASFSQCVDTTEQKFIDPRYRDCKITIFINDDDLNIYWFLCNQRHIHWFNTITGEHVHRHHAFRMLRKTCSSETNRRDLPTPGHHHRTEMGNILEYKLHFSCLT